MNIFNRLLSSFKSDGFANTIARASRSVMYRLRGRILLGKNLCCARDFRILGKKYFVFDGSASFGYSCRIEAYSEYCEQRFSPSVRIGDGTSFGDYLHIGAIGNITIGNNVLFGSGILIIDHDHGSYSGDCQSNTSISPKNRKLTYRGDIVISDNVWVGDGVTIFGGANIGAGCVIAAGALVSGKIPDGSICVGKNQVLKVFNPKTERWERA